MPIAPADRAVWELQGTPEENAVVEWALARCTYPFHKLVPGLQAQVGRATIPVQWADLSRFATARGAASDTPHDHEHEHEHGPDRGEWGHSHVDGAHGISFRGIPLGLAYYSGKVVLHSGLRANPELAAEVFLSEAAHMVDFFGFTDADRRAVYNALHPGAAQDYVGPAPIADGVDLGHGHGWFDVAGYRAWAGEGFMGLFVKAYSDVTVSIPFDHPPTQEAVEETRAALTPTPAPVPTVPVWGVTGSVVFHSQASATGRHAKLYPSLDVTWPSRDAAVADGRRPCRLCKP